MKIRAVLAVASVASAATGGALAAADAPVMVETNIFAGAAGWKVITGSTRLIAAEVKPGDVLGEQGVRYLRTGRFRGEVVSGGALAKERIPAGSPAYAVRLDGFGTGWCTPGGDERDLGARLASRNKERCIFVSPSGGMIRTQGYDGKSPFAASAMTGQYGVITPVQVDEQPVDFGRNFRIVATLGKLTAREARIDYWFDDGANRTRLVVHRLKPGADGHFLLPLWGGRLRLERSGTGLRGVMIAPPRDVLDRQPELRGDRIMAPTVRIIWI